jgi:hypothetical protein
MPILGKILEIAQPPAPSQPSEPSPAQLFDLPPLAPTELLLLGVVGVLAGVIVYQNRERARKISKSISLPIKAALAFVGLLAFLVLRM